jgi:putative membrane protein
MNMVVIILVVIVIIIVALFSVQNAVPVAISFLSWHFDASLAIIALLFFLAGMIAGMGVLSWTRMRRAAKKRIAASQKQPEGESHSGLPR